MLGGLKEKYPRSRVCFLVGSDYAGLLEDNPCVDEIIAIPEKEYRYQLRCHPERFPQVFNRVYELVSELRQREIDLAINRQYEWGALVAYLAGSQRIWGGSYSPGDGFHFQDQNGRDLYDTIRKRRKTNRRNLVDWACRIAQVPCGQHHHGLLRPSASAHWEVRNLLGVDPSETGKSVVAIQMGAAKSHRQWGVENFAQIARWLIGEKGRTVALVGSEDERDLAEEMGHRLGPAAVGLRDLVGRTSLDTLGATMAASECLITGDTGSMHVAAAVGTPVLSLFFATAYPWETGPYGAGHFVLYSDVPCAPCLDPAGCREGLRCRRELTVDIVRKSFETADAFWKHESWNRPPGNGCVKLFATVLDDSGEQMLLPIQDASASELRSPTRIRREHTPETAFPPLLRDKGDEVIRAFGEGEIGKGFLMLTDYLGCWMAAKDAFLTCHPEKADRLSRLLTECLSATQSRDVVTLVDAIEYGLRPLVQQGPAQDQNPVIEREHART